MGNVTYKNPTSHLIDYMASQGVEMQEDPFIPKGSEIKEQVNDEVINNQEVVNGSDVVNDVNSQVVNNIVSDNQPVINNPVVDNQSVNNSVVSEPIVQPQVNNDVAVVADIPVAQMPVAEIVDNNVDTNLEIFEF